MAHKDTHNPPGQSQLQRSHLDRTLINDEVCTRCGQCCRLEEYFEPGDAGYLEGLYEDHQYFLNYGMMMDRDLEHLGIQPVTLPMVLDTTFKPGRKFITCAHLDQSTNRCTNFDSDGTDLRPYTCKDWYCSDGRGSGAVRGNQPDHFWLPDHIDLDIVKVIVDDVRGTNLSGGD
jgi:hypothetical protein